MRRLLIRIGYVLFILSSSLYAVEYYVVYHNDLAGSWVGQFQEWKTGEGYEVLLESINSGTKDDIKNMIDANSENLQYVLLIGDANELPENEQHIISPTNGNFIPFDYQSYSGFGSDYGQDYTVPSDDYYIENCPGATIGRIPAETTQQIQDWLTKAIEISQNFSKYEIWKNNITMFVHNMDNPSNGGKGIYLDSETTRLNESYLNNTSYIKSYQYSANYPEEHWNVGTKGDVFENEINNGRGLIYTHGVGADWRFLVSFYAHSTNEHEEPFCDWDFQNTGKYPFLFGQSCSIGKIQKAVDNLEYDSILEDLLFLPQAGIIGAIAPAHITFDWTNHYFTDLLFSHFLYGTNKPIGVELQQIKEELPNCEYMEDFEWQAKTTMLYGDPSMSLPFFQYANRAHPVYNKINPNITFPSKINEVVDPNVISESTTWQGSIIVESDITITSNAKLTIKPGTGIFFNPGAKLRVYGTLIAEGTAEYPINFSSASETPSSGDWYGIRFEDSSVDANCIIKYANIEYATFGIYSWKASPTIEDNTFSYNTYSIYLLYSSSSIQNNEITQSSRGIYAYKSNPDVNYNRIDNNTYGVVCYNSSSPYMHGNTFNANNYGAYITWYSSPKFVPLSYAGGYNVISNSTSRGIYAASYASPFLGSSTSENGPIGGYNSVYGSSQYNVYAKSITNVEAEYNWWGSSPPVSSKFYYDGSSTIDYNPYLTFDPIGGSALNRTINNNSFAFVSDLTLARTTVTGEGGFDPYKPDTNAVDGLWVWAKDLWLTENPLEAIRALKILIRRFSNAPEAPQALVLLVSLYQETETAGLSGYLNSLANKRRNINNQIRTVASNILVGTYVNEGRINQAINTANKIIRRNPNSASEYLALFNLFSIYKNELNDKEQAQAILDILIKSYPDYDLTLMAQLEMGEDVDWSNSRMFDPQAGAEKTVTAYLETLPEEYRLGNNYPNPFNPTTVIPYELPDNSYVSLVIYGVLGREIIRLIDGEVSAGFRHVQWDGRDHYGKAVSNGLYIYRISARGISAKESSGQTRVYNGSGKMILIR